MVGGVGFEALCPWRGRNDDTMGRGKSDEENPKFSSGNAYILDYYTGG